MFSQTLGNRVTCLNCRPNLGKRVAGNFVARRPDRQSKIGKTCLNLVVFLRKELPEILLLGDPIGNRKSNDMSKSRRFPSKRVAGNFVAEVT
jgi:hypothetical protein